VRGALTLLALCGCRAILGIDDVGGGPPDVPDLVPDTPSGLCPADFQPLASGSAHRYLVLAGPDDYASQRAACAARGPSIYLVVPDDQAELDAMVQAAGGFTFWVGIDDRAIEGSFVTTKGAPATFLPWAAGEPSGEDCVLVASDGTFHDDDCLSAFPSACECEP
jgi:hypothetical protein